MSEENNKEEITQEEIIPKRLTEKEKKDLETTINTRVKKLGTKVKEIEKKTNSFIVNASPHGVASLGIYFFVLSQNYYSSGDYKNCAIYFGIGAFTYIVQQALFVLKIKIGNGDISEFLNKNNLINAVGEATTFRRK